jgi:predicted methyltransferase MtxX (methanogen marker protein 4)
MLLQDTVCAVLLTSVNYLIRPGTISRGDKLEWRIIESATEFLHRYRMFAKVKVHAGGLSARLKQVSEKGQRGEKTSLSG